MGLPALVNFTSFDDTIKEITLNMEDDKKFKFEIVTEITGTAPDEVKTVELELTVLDGISESVIAKQRFDMDAVNGYIKVLGRLANQMKQEINKK